MSRSLAVVVVFLIAAPIGQSAPRLRQALPAHYFPTPVGDTRVLESDVGNGNIEVVETVTAVEENDGRLIVTTRSALGEEAGPEHQWEVSDRGVVELVHSGFPLRSPVCRLRLPAKPRETWSTEDQPSGERTTLCGVSFTTGSEEVIVVPAGRFRAIRVESSHGTTFWYAPDVGLVKWVHKSPRVNEPDHVAVLKSFTAGKK
jgi:hypothetical protein